MSKDQKKTKKQEIVKRKDYQFLVDLVSQTKELDLTKETNTDLVKSKYLAISNNKVFSNIKRVIKRSLRAEILPLLEKELSEKNLTLTEYKEITYNISKLAENKKASKLIEVNLI